MNEQRRGVQVAIINHLLTTVGSALDEYIALAESEPDIDTTDDLNETISQLTNIAARLIDGAEEEEETL